jgi:hypothetical protein
MRRRLCKEMEEMIEAYEEEVEAYEEEEVNDGTMTNNNNNENDACY